MAKDSRASMVRSAASLIRTRGMSATSFSDVLTESRAPRGSIYHHFPQGKEQLASDAIRWTSERVLAHQRGCRATTPAGVLDCFIDMWRQVVVASRGTAGCVVAGVAIDTAADERGLIEVVRATFRSWIDLLTEQLVAVGLPARRASAIALATVAGMEGALILCRAERSSAPLETVATELKGLLPDRGTGHRPASGRRRRTQTRRG
jgi:AcrR family transcriptional regulator